MRYLVALTIVLFSAVAFMQATKYAPTEDYAIKFSTAKATGTFRDLQGTIDFDPAKLEEANMDVSVATATIETGNKTQDKHARGGSWLDAEHHPRILFKSHSFAKTAAGYEVDGQLTIRGESMPVTIPFTFDGKTFAGTVTVARADFGIDGPFLFGGLVGKEVTVELNVPVKQR